VVATVPDNAKMVKCSVSKIIRYIT